MGTVTLASLDSLSVQVWNTIQVQYRGTVQGYSTRVKYTSKVHGYSILLPRRSLCSKFERLTPCHLAQLEKRLSVLAVTPRGRDEETAVICCMIH